MAVGQVRCYVLRHVVRKMSLPEDGDPAGGVGRPGEGGASQNTLMMA